MDRPPSRDRSCPCPHHDHDHDHHHARPRGRDWSSLLPLLACAVCPGCLASYAKVLATLGVGIAFTETEHVALLVVCIALSLVVGVREARLTRRWAPLAVNVAGCGALVVAHARSDSSSISWLGVVLILGGAVWSHRLRFARRSHVHHAKHAAALKLESTSSA